jgi:hypothetical protein
VQLVGVSSLQLCAEEGKETPRKRRKGEDGALEPRDPAELRAEALQLLRKSYAISQHGIQGTWGEEASFILPANAIRAWRPIEVTPRALLYLAWLDQCGAM